LNIKRHKGTIPASNPIYTIVTVRLTSGEVIPILVENSSWIPVRLATRWVLLHRRLRSASNTLRNNLFTLKFIYSWAKTKEIDLDELLLSKGMLGRDQIKSLVTELQDFRANHTKLKVISTIGKISKTEIPDLGKKITEAQIAVPIDHDLTIIEDFLSWVLDPFNVGSKTGNNQNVISIDHLNSTRSAIRSILDAYKVGITPSRRLAPLTHQEMELLHNAISPIRTIKGRVSASSLFPRTPWTPPTCLRNWLMFCIAEQCGLRIGEILKLTIEDINSLTLGSPLTIQVRRRPDDPLDTRVHPPAVKTSERVLEGSPEIAWGLRLYLTLRPPLGRVRGQTPYLFVTETGDPLSYASAYRAITLIGKHINIRNLTWHRLRHTWAESLAKDLLKLNSQGVEPQVIEKLRYLGGWSEKSKTPFHYIRDAIRESANDFLRKRNERMYQ
jgi:integrase